MTTIEPDMDEVYSQWVELEALALTAEYCAEYGISDHLEVRLVHYHALAIVLARDE